MQTFFRIEWKVISESGVFFIHVHFIGYHMHISTHLRIDGLIIKSTSFFLGGQILQPEFWNNDLINNFVKLFILNIK